MGAHHVLQRCLFAMRVQPVRSDLRERSERVFADAVRIADARSEKMINAARVANGSFRLI